MSNVAPPAMFDLTELDSDPVFDYGTKVRSTKHIKNDGTYPGAEIGEVLVRKGDVGYVNSIGTFLQRYYIFGVDFVETGKLVGMRSRELEKVEDED
jgi:nitrogen fixation protein NifZ